MSYISHNPFQQPPKRGPYLTDTGRKQRWNYYDLIKAAKPLSEKVLHEDKTVKMYRQLKVLEQLKYSCRKTSPSYTIILL